MQKVFQPLKNSLAEKISVKSAVNPSLWACAVISIFSFSISTQATGWLQAALFIVGLVPVLCFTTSYLYLLFKNPDYLRSEEYQLIAESLKLLGDKDNALNANANDIVSIVNNPKLPPPNKEN